MDYLLEINKIESILKRFDYSLLFSNSQSFIGCLKDSKVDSKIITVIGNCLRDSGTYFNSAMSTDDYDDLIGAIIKMSEKTLINDSIISEALYVMRSAAFNSIPSFSSNPNYVQTNMLLIGNLKTDSEPLKSTLDTVPVRYDFEYSKYRDAHYGDIAKNIEEIRYFLLKSGTASDTDLFNEMKRLADLGDPWAIYDLGDLYYSGIGVSKNVGEALKRYHEAAKLGNIGAEMTLGWMYREGTNVEQSFDESFKYLTDAANHGIAAAQCHLAMWYIQVPDSRQSYTKALFWAKKAADQEFPSAYMLCGCMYTLGYGVPKSVSDSIKWMSKAGDSGDLYAQNILAAYYYLGDFYPQSYDEAYRWATIAINNDPECTSADVSKLIYCFLYLFGDSVPQSIPKAREWLLKLSPNYDSIKKQFLELFDTIESIPDGPKYVISQCQYVKKGLELGISLPMPPPRNPDEIFASSVAGNIRCESHESKYIPVSKMNTQNTSSRTISPSSLKKDTFTGSLINGQPSGYGKLTTSYGCIYEGNFTNGKLNGYGSYYNVSGNFTYVGDFKDGAMHGRGKISMGNGDSFEGIFKNNHADGSGVYTWGPNSNHPNCSLHCEWSNDQPIGRGSFYDEKGKKKLLVPKDLKFARPLFK